MGRVMSKRTHPPVLCAYCGAPAQLLADSSRIYHGRDFGPVWRCDPCEAHVGCHPGTVKPLGRLANAELRQAKAAAHAAFDPLWRAKIARTGCAKSRARGAGYAWLAAQMGVEVRDCHIGMFDVAQCVRVVEVCRAARKARAA